MRHLPYLAVLMLAAQTVSSSGKLPLDDLPAALRAQAADVQAAWEQHPDNACVLYYVAAMYARAGHAREAIDTLRRMAGEHAGLDPRLRDGFQSLASDPEFLRLKEEIRGDNAPVNEARPAFAISESNLMPEGIAWSGRQERFYLGSGKRKIIVVDGAGHAHDFVPPGEGGLGFVVGLRVDDSRGELWAASEQLSPRPGLVRGIFRYRLSDGKVLAKYPAPSEGADLVNDLVVAADGSVYATASNSGSLLRVAPGGASLEIFLPPHSLPDPNGITISHEGRFLFVAGWYGITRVDLKSKATLQLKSVPQISVGCIDGLYEYGGDLVGIQNCVHDTGRVLRLHLNPQRDTIVSAQVLESYNPLFEGITTGAIAGHDFYFAANTQIHKMAADGSIPPGVSLSPIQVLRLPLKRRPARP
jgi:sugar lactone lactonase YvrE